MKWVIYMFKQIKAVINFISVFSSLLPPTKSSQQISSLHRELKSQPYDVPKRIFQILVEALNLGPLYTKLAALMQRFEDLNVDYEELILLKYQILLNSDTSRLQQHEIVEAYQDQLTILLQERCANMPKLDSECKKDDRKRPTSLSESQSRAQRSKTSYASTDRYTLLLLLISELRLLSMQCEESLLRMHLSKRMPDNLLVEMLYHKRKTHLQAAQK